MKRDEIARWPPNRGVVSNTSNKQKVDFGTGRGSQAVQTLILFAFALDTVHYSDQFHDASIRESVVCRQLMWVRSKAAINFRAHVSVFPTVYSTSD